jgi:hypothetical protein
MRVLLIEKDAAMAARIGGLRGNEEAALDLTRTDGAFDLIIVDVHEGGRPPLLPYLRDVHFPPVVFITSLWERDALQRTVRGRSRSRCSGSLDSLLPTPYMMKDLTRALREVFEG